jgi:hypothetical protein
MNPLPTTFMKTFVDKVWPQSTPKSQRAKSSPTDVPPRRSNDKVELSPRAVATTAPKPLPDQEKLEAMARRHVDQSFKRVPDWSRDNRHGLNALVQAQEPEPTKAEKLTYYDGSPVVVIAFEGTASFDERRTPAMQALGRELQSAGHDTLKGDFDPADLVEGALEEKRGKDTNWSGLSQGAFHDIIRNPKLNQNIQLLSFPSEEAEVLGSRDAYKDLDPSELVGDVLLSSSGTSRGIEHAIQRIQKISAEAKAQGKDPKFVVLSHSSGGRSTVKFLERLKRETNPVDGKPYQIPLVISIDPVKEAHEALKEGSREILNKGTEHNANKVRRLFGRAERKVWPPVIGATEQPGILYNTGNVGQWLNFYQTEDILGLQEGPRLGLRGSPVRGAENIRIRGVGDDGHGSINWNGDLLERVNSELTELVEGR